MAAKHGLRTAWLGGYLVSGRFLRCRASAALGSAVKANIRRIPLNAAQLEEELGLLRYGADLVVGELVRGGILKRFIFWSLTRMGRKTLHIGQKCFKMSGFGEMFRFPQSE